MADNGFSISIDLGAVMAAGGVLTKDVFPRVHEAIGAVANQAAKNWADAVMSAPGVWSEEKKAYAGSIKWDYVNDYHARVTTDYKYASQIEHGRPARDLKIMLNTSQKVRRTMQGKRFLVIPFRHNVDSMPENVAAAAAQLVPSKILGTTQRRSGELTAFTPGRGMTPLSETRQRRAPYLSNPQTKGPAMVAKQHYQWGDRLGGRGKYSGMYRFDTQGKGAVRHSSYLTFRIMMEGQPGWIVPAKPGLNLVKGVVNGLNPVAEQVIRQAATLDLGG